MVFTLIINGQVVTYEINTFELSYSKYENSDVLLIFNGTQLTDSETFSTEKEAPIVESKQYVAENVNKPSSKGISNEVFFGNQPLHENSIFQSMLDSARDALQIKVVDTAIEGGEEIVIITDNFSVLDTDQAIQQLAEKESQAIPSGVIRVIKNPVIHTHSNEDSGVETSDRCIITETIIEGKIV